MVAVQLLDQIPGHHASQSAGCAGKPIAINLLPYKRVKWMKDTGRQKEFGDSAQGNKA
jgi:hypothetical protein